MGEVPYADGSMYGEKTIDRAIANTSEYYGPESGDESAEVHATRGTLATDAGRDESDRSHMYLTEKNRLLTDRIDEPKATLVGKTSVSTHLKQKLSGTWKNSQVKTERQIEPTKRTPWMLGWTMTSPRQRLYGDGQNGCSGVAPSNIETAT